MSLKKHIRNILVIGFWSLAGAGLLVLLVAAMRDKQDKACSGIDIAIVGEDSALFLDRTDIQNLLSSNGGQKLKGALVRQIDLRKLEEKLKANVWVANAECYLDNKQLLKVKVWERMPVARIFTVNGSSFYADSSAILLPLADKYAVKLPVFTGYPYEKDIPGNKDSLLLRSVIAYSNCIRSNPFWSAMTAQVDILPDQQFELIPVIGNQVIELGNGTDAEKKFRRLDLFYRQVMTKAGPAAYERIKVQYAGQVVGVKKGVAVSRYDSIQAIRNVEQMIRNMQDAQERMARLDSIAVAGMASRQQAVSNAALAMQPDSLPPAPQTQIQQKPVPDKNTNTNPSKQQKNNN